MPRPPTFPGYGTGSGNNNVINYLGSPVSDPYGDGSSFIGSTASSMAVLTTSLSSYTVEWWFIGAESGYQNTLQVPGFFSHSENNQNSNCCGPGGSLTPLIVGTSTGSSSVIDFTLKDNVGANFVTNGVNNAQPATDTRPSIVFSYVNFIAADNWVLTKSATDYVLFAYNDTGGPDDNHDDYIGIAHAFGRPGGSGEVPIPGALILMGSALAGAGGIARWRRRRRS